MWPFFVMQGHMAFQDGQFEVAKQHYSVALQQLWLMPACDEFRAVMVEIFCRNAECNLHLVGYNVSM